MTDTYRKWLVLLAGLIFFIADRLIKNFIILGDQSSLRSPVSYFPNKNLAFSLPLPEFLLPLFYFLVILVILVVFGLFLSSWRHCQWPCTIGYWFIFLGAASNLIDRFRFSAVIDFIDLKFWPVFNLADIMIVVGIIFLLFELFHSKKTVS
ncbi:hypothetical protein GYA54_03980 [Candidatus Kuenenbacteria bacterium]|nr:hypothetical protein [Candidatus Kuenenbacteria bacterium]